MTRVGFSSGALAKGDFRRALRMLEGHEVPVLELSALRTGELSALIEALDEIRVEERFDYVSFHAPSKFAVEDEAHVVEQLARVAERNWPIIVHPGVLHTPKRWLAFGGLLCIENMDRRNANGRTCNEMGRLFAIYPQASFCLDLGHARQIDPSMVEAYRMLRRLGDRLRQVHLSEVTTTGRHARISYTAKVAYQGIAYLLREDLPVVVESVLTDSSEVAGELASAQEALTPPIASALPTAAE